MPGIFKGLEKSEDNGQLVARIGYPNARTFTPHLQDGKMVMEVKNTPREVTMTETEFSKKFGVDFQTVGNLPFKEEGYPLAQIAPRAEEKGAAPTVSTPTLAV